MGSEQLAKTEAAEGLAGGTLESQQPFDDAGALALDIAAALGDVDLADSLAFVIEGVPDGARLSVGRNNGDRTWSLSFEELAEVSFIPAPARRNHAILTVRVLREDKDGYDGAQTTAMFDVAGRAVPNAATAEELRAECDQRRAELRERLLAEQVAAAAPQWQSEVEDAATSAAEAEAAEMDHLLQEAEAAWKHATQRRLDEAASQRHQQQNQRLTEAAEKWQAEEAQMMAAATAEWQAEEERRLAEAEAQWKAEQEVRFAQVQSEWAAAQDQHLREAEEARRIESEKRISEAETELRSKEAQRLVEAEAELVAGEKHRVAELEEARRAEMRQKLDAFADQWKREEEQRLIEAEAGWKSSEEERLAAMAARRKAEIDRQLANADRACSAEDAQRLIDFEAAREAEDRRKLEQAQRERVEAEQRRIESAVARWKQHETGRMAEAEAEWKAAEARRLTAAQAERQAAAEGRLAQAANKVRAGEAQRLTEAEAEAAKAERQRIAGASARWLEQETKRFQRSQAEWYVAEEKRLATAAATRRSEADKQLAAAGVGWEDELGRRLTETEADRRKQERDWLEAAARRRQELHERRMAAASAMWKAEGERRIAQIKASSDGGMKQQLAEAIVRQKSVEARQAAAANLRRVADVAADAAAEGLDQHSDRRLRLAKMHSNLQQMESRRLGVMHRRWQTETGKELPEAFQRPETPQGSPCAVQNRWAKITMQQVPQAFARSNDNGPSPAEIKSRWQEVAARAAPATEGGGIEAGNPGLTWAKWTDQAGGAAAEFDKGIAWRASRPRRRDDKGPARIAEFIAAATDGSTHTVASTGLGLSIGDLQRIAQPAPTAPTRERRRTILPQRLRRPAPDAAPQVDTRRIQPTAEQLREPAVQEELLQFTRLTAGRGETAADSFTFHSLGITVDLRQDLVLVIGNDEIPVKAKPAPAATRPDEPPAGQAADTDASEAESAQPEAELERPELDIPPGDPWYTIQVETGSAPHTDLGEARPSPPAGDTIPLAGAEQHDPGSGFEAVHATNRSDDVAITPPGFDTFAVGGDDSADNTAAGDVPTSDGMDCLPVRNLSATGPRPDGADDSSIIPIRRKRVAPTRKTPSSED